MILMVLIVVTGLWIAAAISWVLAFLTLYGDVVFSIIGAITLVIYGLASIGLKFIWRFKRVQAIISKEAIKGFTGWKHTVAKICRILLIIVTIFCILMCIVGIGLLITGLFII